MSKSQPTYTREFKQQAVQLFEIWQKGLLYLRVYSLNIVTYCSAIKAN